MPDGFAHVLFAYTACVGLSGRYEWLTAPYRTAGMAGGLIPDLAKLGIFVPDGPLVDVLSVPFSWDALQTGGAALVCVGIGALLVVPHERRRITGVLAVGAGTHLLTDALLAKPSGHSFAIFWPLTRYHPPTPGLYQSTDPGPTAVALILAISVWLITRLRASHRSSGQEG